MFSSTKISATRVRVSLAKPLSTPGLLGLLGLLATEGLAPLTLILVSNLCMPDLVLVLAVVVVVVVSCLLLTVGFQLFSPPLQSLSLVSVPQFLLSLFRRNGFFKKICFSSLFCGSQHSGEHSLIATNRHESILLQYPNEIEEMKWIRIHLGGGIGGKNIYEEEK